MTTLSLCMIVKNEADNLPRCLDSVRGLVDEIVVVDTGSTDATRELAQAAGARVVDFPWSGSFSEARNVSLAHAQSEWILILDADEVLSRGKEQLRELIAEHQDHEGFFLPVVNFTGIYAYRQAAIHPAFRLFRNRPYSRFTRKLHEQVATTILAARPDARFAHLPIQIEHFGYLNPQVFGKAKVERNLELARAEVRANVFDSFSWHNLALEYLRMMRWSAALYCYRRAFFHADSLMTGFVPSVLKNMAGCLFNLRRFNDALILLREAQPAYPDFVDLVFFEGTAELELGNCEAALAAFQRCLRSGSTTGSVFMCDEGMESYRALHAMGECYQRSGRLDQATDYYEQAVGVALEQGRYFEQAIDGLVRMRTGQGELALLILRRFERLAGGSLATQPTLALLVARSLLACPPVSPETLVVVQRLLWTAAIAPAAERLLTSARLNLYLRRYRKAAEDYERIPLSAPEAAQAWLHGALACGLAGDWEHARARLDAVQCVGLECQALRDFHEALLRVWSTGGEKHTLRFDGAPTVTALLETQLWETLALLLQLQEFEYFERTLPLIEALGISREQAALKLGKLYYRFGFNDSALQELLDSVRWGTADQEAYTVMGRECLRRQRFDHAEWFFAEALQRVGQRNHRWTAYMGMASACLAQGKHSQAALALQGAEMAAM